MTIKKLKESVGNSTFSRSPSSYAIAGVLYAKCVRLELDKHFQSQKNNQIKNSGVNELQFYVLAPSFINGATPRK